MDLPLCCTNHSFVFNVQLNARATTSYCLNALTPTSDEEAKREEKCSSS
jgi:hypothetical protein